MSVWKIWCCWNISSSCVEEHLKREELHWEIKSDTLEWWWTKQNWKK